MPRNKPFRVNSIFQDVVEEMEYARNKFPKPDNMTAVIAEEFGELCAALLQQVEKERPSSDVYREGIQVITTVLRLLVEGDTSFPKYSLEKAIKEMGKR